MPCARRRQQEGRYRDRLPPRGSMAVAQGTSPQVDGAAAGIVQFGGDYVSAVMESAFDAWRGDTGSASQRHPGVGR